MFSVYFSFTLLSIPKWLLFFGILRDTISNRLHLHFVALIGLLLIILMLFNIVWSPPPPHSRNRFQVIWHSKHVMSGGR